MSGMQTNPGQLRYQLGQSMASIRTAISANDVPLVMNQVSYMRALASPIMGAMTRPETFEAGTFHEAYRSIQVAEDCSPEVEFRADMDRLQVILLAAAHHGEYAFKHTAVKDASHLAELASASPGDDEADAG